MAWEFEVDGLKEMRRGLKQLGGSQLQREMGKANKEVGKRIVSLSRSRQTSLAGRYGSYRSRVVKIRPSASQARLQVTVNPGAAERGARRHPVYGRWQDQADFRRRVWPREIRGDDGYLVRPTVQEHSAEIGEVYVEEIGRLARRVLG